MVEASIEDGGPFQTASLVLIFDNNTVIAGLNSNLIILLIKKEQKSIIPFF